MSAPPLSVVMGVYNASAYLVKTLDSLQAQTFPDYELICVDDGSTDASLDILRAYAARDSRLQIVEFPKNRGLSCALNEAMGRARGAYVAVADSDDLYLKERFENQVAFLQKHDDTVAVSSSMIFIDEEDRAIGWEARPESDTAIRWRMLFNSAFSHPSIMMRRAALQKMERWHSPELKVAMDYEMWPRLLRLGKGFNFKEPFLLYRLRKTSISNARRDEMIRCRDAICAPLQREAFGDHGLSLEEIDRLRRLFFNKPRPHEIPELRTYETARPEDVETYVRLLKLFVTKLPRDEARRFLAEDQELLGRAYLFRIGLEDLDLVREVLG